MTFLTTIANQTDHPVSSAAERDTQPIRVLLADDHPAVRLGMHKLIDDQPDMVVIREARSAEDALDDGSAGGDGREDVAVLDYHLGASRDGLWVTRQLKRREHAPSVLIYSAFADSALAAAAIVAGADGLLSKTSLGEELCNAIRELAHGRRYLPAVPQAVAQALSSQLRTADQSIFWMLVADVEPDDIAQRLELSHRELEDRRGIMLLAIAPASQPLEQSHAPLDYDRPHRHSHYEVK